MSSETNTPSLVLLADTPITDAIPPEPLAQALANPPFVSVPGTVNFRSVGPVSADGKQLRPGFVFRSGNMSRITEEGKAKLVNELGVKKIFDLRVEAEVKGSPPPTIEGVKVMWVKEEKVMGKPDTAQFAADQVQAYVDLYLHVLDTHHIAYTSILRHILTSPSEPFVFHCTGGKDRTGVFSALLLALTSFPAHEIGFDYSLTRIGVEPSREVLLVIMKRDQGFDIEAPGILEILGTRPANMVAFLGAVDSKYGGAEGYLTKELGFKPEEVEQIKRNLLGPL